VSTLVSLAFVSQALAVLRPPFPAKPAAPFDGELIIIGDNLVPESAKMPAASPKSGMAAGAVVHVSHAKRLSHLVEIAEGIQIKLTADKRISQIICSASPCR
jgi:hypothetical protein